MRICKRAAGALLLIAFSALGCRNSIPVQSRCSYFPQSNSQFEVALALEKSGNAGCVELYYRAAIAAYPTDGSLVPEGSDYQRCLVRLIESALRFKKLDPQKGLLLNSTTAIPLKYRGLAWDPREVGEFHSTCEVDVLKYLKHHHRNPGWGAPLIGMSRDVGLRGELTKFTSEPRPISLTAILTSSGELELFDGTHVQTAEIAGRTVPLARDLSAPLAFLSKQSAQRGEQAYMVAFKSPGKDPNYERLAAVEPYRPGTFPLILVHGARSDDATWLDCINDLRTDPEVARRYQILTFRYETGRIYLNAAAGLREQCRAFVEKADPTGQDAALRSAVMVGYSLGGPVARLAVTHSGPTLWNAFSTRPLESLGTSDEVRAGLKRHFFFEPLPYVSDVVFIAAPFDGGTPISNTFFRIVSRTIRLPPDTVATYQKLQRDNPEAIRPEALGTLPNSVDLLRSNNWLLNALRELPFREGVRVHTIVGNGFFVGLSDRLVPVRSARVPGHGDETFVNMLHKDGTRHPGSVARQRQILIEHAAEFDRERGKNSLTPPLRTP